MAREIDSFADYALELERKMASEGSWESSGARNTLVQFCNSQPTPLSYAYARRALARKRLSQRDAETEQVIFQHEHPITAGMLELLPYAAGAVAVWYFLGR